MKPEAFFPPLVWGRDYTVDKLRLDLIAGMIVLVITIPQSIAYALLAGMPPVAGLYAAVAGLVCYAAFGSSRVLAVGPTAIVSVMTLEAVSRVAIAGTVEYVGVAIRLAAMTGVILLILRAINFGAVVSFLSHAVVTGFIAAAAVIIVVSQLPDLLGLPANRSADVFSKVAGFVSSLGNANVTTALIGCFALLLLIGIKLILGRLLRAAGLSDFWQMVLVRSAPLYVVVIGAAAVWALSLHSDAGVSVIGVLPAGLPEVMFSVPVWREVTQLLPSALLIGMVIFVESTSVGTAVASKRRETIDPNQELIGTGVANIGASLVGGFPVAGSFGRTVVNFDSGAVSPVASLFTALLLLLTLLLLSPAFYYLPSAVLAAIIVVSALQLIDLRGIRKIFSFNPVDGVTFSVTFFAVLIVGVEMGILVGIVISFILLIRASSKPHIAVVGRWRDTEHFRNVNRHDVKTSNQVLAVRIDESLYFVNVRFIENHLLDLVAGSPDAEHLVLICTATNFIDSSGLEMLEKLSENLAEVGVTLHLSEVKGPVMDRLKETEFFANMRGQVFFTTDVAMRELAAI